MCPYMRMVGMILSNIGCPYKVVLYCKMDDELGVHAMSEGCPDKLSGVRIIDFSYVSMDTM